MMNRRLFHRTWLLISLCSPAWVACAEDVKLDWLPSGALNKLGYYRPVQITLAPDKPEGIKTVPADLVAPLYGKLQLGPAEAPATFFVIVDEPPGKPSRLFVDANANGDLTDDPPSEWNARIVKGNDGAPLTNYMGGADFPLSFGSEKVSLRLKMYRFDVHDTSRADYVNALFYYRDYGRVGQVSLDGKSFQAMLVDDSATGDFRPGQGAAGKTVNLLLDLNQNGKFELYTEAFDVSAPFKIGEINYEVTGLDASGASFQIAKTAKAVAQKTAGTPRAPRPPPSQLAAGAKALAFDATTTDGSTIHFPQSFKGKLVLLDFWATWCGPCRAEIPHVASAYEKFHARGFEVLGVSLDQANASEKLAQFTKENHMAWPEVYDGKYWQAAVARAYSINSIPHAFLVDGDTGTIAAEGDEIRGENLAPTIEKALAKH